MVDRRKINISQYHYTKHRSKKTRYRLIVAEEAILTESMTLICLPSNLLEEFLSILIRIALSNFSPKTKLIYIKLEINCKQTYSYRLNDTDKQIVTKKKKI